MAEYTEKHREKCVQNGRNCCGYCCTKIQNFSVKIGKNEIIKDVNMHLHCGEMTALIGPNGAGKSTLLKAILGEVRHDGTLIFADPSGQNAERPVIGYVPQQLEFDAATPLSVRDLFTACMGKRPAWRKSSPKVENSILACLDSVQAGGLIDRRLGALSGGELQRVLLALALEPIPQLLLLDEPVSGVDRKGLELFYEIVSRIRKLYDLTIILVSHDLDIVQKHADRVVLLNKTIILNGPPAQVYRDKRLHETFGLSGLLPNDRQQNQREGDDAQ